LRSGRVCCIGQGAVRLAAPVRWLHLHARNLCWMLQGVVRR
jgi:hypothetical protein